MGTPEFAVPTLEALDAHQQVVGVVTQPDRPAGRGRQLTASPVKEAALARGLEVFQPRSLRPADALAHLAGWRPDVVVVAAFGQILHQPVLELAPHGCLNLHPSLLPRWRGPAPVSAAILAGDDVTGVTIMRLDEGVDTGPVVAQVVQPIGPRDTTGSLTASLAELGARLLVDTLPGWIESQVEARPQDDARATYSEMLRKEDGRLDWQQSAVFLDRQVRACDPWPGAFTTWQSRRLKVLRARPRPGWRGAGRPGEVVALAAGVGVVASEGVLELVEVQLAGKKATGIEPFVRGQRDFVGAMLGT
jgi:methionyl-tRNA formyltransferase